MEREDFLKKCEKLLEAYQKGDLGQTKMPEDSNPFLDKNISEEKLSYFTLPMALNYQRDSYKLWEAALKTFNDKETKDVFNLKSVAQMSENQLREKLTKHKLALQPNKHINTWKIISKTIFENWGSLENLFKQTNNDFIYLQKTIQEKHKKGFPYLSGPKIFHYWCFIIQGYGRIKLKNSDLIEIAPDTHITKCSVILGVISDEEAITLTKDQISERWRKSLANTKINPINMHPPLWFWSRNNFKFNLNQNET